MFFWCLVFDVWCLHQVALSCDPGVSSCCGLVIQPIILAGPTAVGKSDIALVLAEKLGGEIISVDSMQVYRGMDIGTAKASRAERDRIPHHLLDVAHITAPFDAAQFVRLARQALTEIERRGRVPILCGGTGLYFKAFLEGLGEGPPADAALRAELEATPMADLLRELAQHDPVTYSRIDRQNPRRVIRAVEVIRLTGKPYALQRVRWSAEGEVRSAQLNYGISRGAEDLRRRIDVRVDAMFRRGLVAETERLLAQGLADNRTAMQALGYRQTEEHLRGVRSLPETIELVKVRTRQFAKRQMTWFRRQMKLTWIAIEPEEPPETTADRILRG